MSNIYNIVLPSEIVIILIKFKELISIYNIYILHIIYYVLINIYYYIYIF